MVQLSQMMPDPQAGRWPNWSGWEATAYLPIGIALTMLLIAGFELRATVIRSIRNDEGSRNKAP